MDSFLILFLQLNFFNVLVVLEDYKVLFDLFLVLDVAQLFKTVHLFIIYCTKKLKPCVRLSSHGRIRDVYSLASVRHGLLEVCF